jgi:F420-dependent oxidoreductase-like protein
MAGNGATTRPPHFGVTLPQISRAWEETYAAAREFDALGYDSVWLCDHMFGVPRNEIPIQEAWTTLCVIGALTERVHLGTLVSPVGFRHPAIHAKALATLDQITKGRVVLGLGIGWNEAEFRGYGLDFPPARVRLQQLAEAAELTKRAWTEDKVDFAGKHFQTQGLMVNPKPYRQPHPPILIGGGGEKVTMRIAAQFADIWNNSAGRQGQLAHKIEVLRRHCADVGRDPSEITVSQQCLVLIAENEAELGAMVDRADKLFGGHMGDPHGPLAIVGTPDRVVDRIQAHLELGCTHFVIEFFGRDTRGPARRFAETVLPRFKESRSAGVPAGPDQPSADEALGGGI